MPGIVLDKRLQAVAELVREGSVVVDVGTDHGHLVCHLVGSRKCPRAFACDINCGPLARARRNILREGLGARIMTMQCDGLSKVPSDAWGDVVIAGMGGDLIARILSDYEGCKDKEKRFVLQPMTKPEHLRRELYRNGFVLLKEVAVQCGSFTYVVMQAQYTGFSVQVSRLFSHTGLLWDKDPCDEDTLDYLRKICELFRKKADGHSKSKDKQLKALEYAALCKTVEERLKALETK